MSVQLAVALMGLPAIVVRAFYVELDVSRRGGDRRGAICGWAP